MRLTPVLVKQTLTQFEAQAIPDNHPAVPELNRLFGDHTFFLDNDGLSIVEPAAEAVSAGKQTARVVNVANWNADLTGLARHEPEPTEAVVRLAPDH